MKYRLHEPPSHGDAEIESPAKHAVSETETASRRRIIENDMYKALQADNLEF